MIELNFPAASISRNELNEVDDWDAPMTRIPPHEAGRNSNWDMKKEMHSVLETGLKSQNRVNMERQNQLLGQWKSVMNAADPDKTKVIVGAWGKPKAPAPGKLIGKLFPTPPLPGRGATPFNLPLKTPEREQTNLFSPTQNSPSRENLPKLNRFSSSNELTSPKQRVLGVFERHNSVPDVVEPSEGKFNFRQMLRKTDYAPTDTLRKMKGDRH